MRLPRSLIINGQRWRVLRKPLARRGLDGICHPAPRREIHLAYGLSPEDLEDTFFHELIHACLSSRWPPRREERMVTKLTPRLLAALRGIGWIPLVLLTLCACGAAPDYVSSRGASYFFQGRHWDSSQIEAQETFFATRVATPWTTRQAEAALARTTVYLMPPSFPCGALSESGRCEGVELAGLVEVADLGCPFNSALTHEVAHVMQSAAGIYDPKHTDDRLWAVADGRASECEVVR